MSSNIIPFPVERIVAMTPERRLARALTQLAASLQAQRSAVEKWRSAATILQNAGDEMGENLGRFNVSGSAATPSNAGTASLHLTK